MKRIIETLQDKRILFGFNLANDFTTTTKLFNKNGIHADLLVKPFKTSRPNVAHPHWEDPSFDPVHIKTWEPSKTRTNKVLTALALGTASFFNILNWTYPARLARKYDVVISTSPGHLYFNNHKGSIIYDAGYARGILSASDLRSRLAEKIYKKAKLVLFTNPDMSSLFRSMNLKRLEFIPLPVDINLYKASKNKNMESERQKEKKFTIFMPSRQEWRVKGTHHFIYAFARAITNANMKLIITEWGVDMKRTKALVKQLKIENSVDYVPVANKMQVQERIHNADIVADQFTAGTFASVSLEAMSCEKPVLVYIKKKEHNDYFGAIPPVINCQSIQSIENSLLELYENQKKIRRIGVASRKWVEEKHSPSVIFERMLHIIDDFLAM